MLTKPPTPSQLARADLAHRLAVATGLGPESVTVVRRLPLKHDTWTHDFLCVDQGTARLVAAWLLNNNQPAGSVEVHGITVYAEIR